MTDNTPVAPTDAELWQLHMQMPGQHKDPIDFARAVLARWGQPAHSGEPLIRQMRNALALPCDRWNATQSRIVREAIDAADAWLEGKKRQ